MTLEETNTLDTELKQLCTRLQADGIVVVACPDGSCHVARSISSGNDATMNRILSSLSCRLSDQ